MNSTLQRPDGAWTGRRRVSTAVAAVALVTGAALAPGALFGAAAANHGISTTASVAMRGTASTTAVSNGTIPSGTSPTYLCWTRGESVHGLNVWFLVNYHGRTGFIPSYYDNSHYSSATDIPGKYGIPTCSTSGHGIKTTAAVTMRGTPHNADASQGSVAKGVSPTYRCWIRGDSVGGLNVWFLVTNGGNSGFIPSHYDNSSYSSATDIPKKYGIPSCSSTSTTPVTIGVYTGSTGTLASKVDAFVTKYNGKFVDVDGIFGAQCTDLFNRFHMDVMGGTLVSMGGNGGAKNLWTTTNTQMLTKYTKVSSGSAAKKGDVAVWGTGTYGHVAIVLADNGSSLNVFQQNACNENDATHKVCPAQTGSHSKSGLLGYFRPKS